MKCSNKLKKIKKNFFDKTQNNDLFISLTAAVDYTERVRDMYTFSELIWNIRKVGKIDSRKMQGQSAFRKIIKYSIREYQKSSADKNVEITNEGHQR